MPDMIKSLATVDGLSKPCSTMAWNVSNPSTTLLFLNRCSDESRQWRKPYNPTVPTA